MSTSWTHLTGILMQGHQVVSRPSAAYPYGTLEKQKPYFKDRGLDLSAYFNGTLNISIAPLAFEMTKPELTFPLVEWTDLHPPETFSFSRCKVKFGGQEYEGWVYYPHPETKKAHFHIPSLIEVITYEIAHIKYGDVLEIEVNLQEITIK
jgi:hypothetical protein